MHRIHINFGDRLYDQASRRAAESGFASLDEYILEVVAGDLSAEPESVDHLITPEQLAHVDSVIAKVKAGGKTHTADEVREHFRKRFEA